MQKAYRQYHFAILMLNLIHELNMKVLKSILFIFILILPFFLLSSSSSRKTQKLYSEFKCYVYQMNALLMEIIPSCFELRVMYDWRVLASKLSLRCFVFSFRHFFGFSCNNSVGVAGILRPYQDC